MSLFRTHLGESDMLAYLAMMAPRLVELRRVLKPTGSLYLHCDPTASHYLKLLMDAIFGPEQFRNEIVWKRTSAHSSAKRYGPVHDLLLFYSKSDKVLWHGEGQDYSPEYIQQRFRTEEDRPWKDADLTGAGTRRGETGKPWRGFDPNEKGRHWAYPPSELDEMDRNGLIYWPKKEDGWPRQKRFLDESKGVCLQDVWVDISPVNSQAQERLHYPTQKPQALLERIINASSNPGDIVLDPFCGCGTAIEAADKTRTWIGIDITVQAMRVIREERLSKFGYKAPKDYQVIYRPADISAAAAFAAEQPFNFQDWAVEMLDGVPTRARSGDRGIDGKLYFQDEQDGPLRQILVSVKGGKLKATFVRELQGAVARERAPMGILVTLHEPSKNMRRDIASGVYTCASGTFPKTQFVTVAEILSGAAMKLLAIRRMDETKKRALVAAENQLQLPGVG